VFEGLLIRSTGVGAISAYTHFYVRKFVSWATFLHDVTENPDVTDQDENRTTRVATYDPVFIAGRGRPAHVLLPIDEFPWGADASSGSIVERLAAPDAADIEFDEPPSGRLFRAADFS
jgi:hypothetical protein